MSDETEMTQRMGTDGQKWAREFLSKDFAPDDIDEGLLICWFANAIMAGYDAGRAAEEKRWLDRSETTQKGDPSYD